MNRVHTVLIIDDDLGFVWWLGSILTEIGCHTIPALNCNQALEFIAKFQLHVNLLIVKAGIPGISQLIRMLNNPDLKTVGIEEDAALAAGQPGSTFDAVLMRPYSREAILKEEWQGKLQTLLNALNLSCASETVRR